ncbi:NAD(P)-dependent oxidoreductase [Chloroflexota bacterium]
MKITIFGATGALGSECLKQSLEAGHEVTVLVRLASKLSDDLRQQITVVEGNGLNASDVERALVNGTEAILFAIGVDKRSPKNLCTDVTRHILDVMIRSNVRRLIWCGGGSTFVEEDQITFGARIVRKIGQIFMPLRHNDKEHQYQLLKQYTEVEWIGVRPLQMRKGPKRAQYRLGFNAFNGMSVVSFADCAHAMVNMLKDDTWLRKAPIIQY